MSRVTEMSQGFNKWSVAMRKRMGLAGATAVAGAAMAQRYYGPGMAGVYGGGYRMMGGYMMGGGYGCGPGMM
jgi:hypothetical protein